MTDGMWASYIAPFTADVVKRCGGYSDENFPIEIIGEVDPETGRAPMVFHGEVWDKYDG